MNHRNDIALVSQMLKGDNSAFNTFFGEYFPRLFQFAYHRLWTNESYAEEAVQIALTKAIEKLDSYRGEAPLYFWLCTFCRHEIGHIIKREGKLGSKVELEGDSEELSDAIALFQPNTPTDPFSQYHQIELKDRINNAKNRIPRLYCNILEWKYLHGFSTNDIAEKIERSPKATESLLTRARNAFRHAFTALSPKNLEAPFNTGKK